METMKNELIFGRARIFKLWVGRLWYEVFIFKTFKQRNLYASYLHGIFFGLSKYRFTNAECFSYTPVKPNGLLNKRGDILFHYQAMGAGILAHEICHAALYLYRFKNPHKHNEKFCQLIESLTKQFWGQWWNKKNKYRRVYL